MRQHLQAAAATQRHSGGAATEQVWLWGCSGAAACEAAVGCVHAVMTCLPRECCHSWTGRSVRHQAWCTWVWVRVGACMHAWVPAWRGLRVRGTGLFRRQGAPQERHKTRDININNRKSEARRRSTQNVQPPNTTAMQITTCLYGCCCVEICDHTVDYMCSPVRRTRGNAACARPLASASPGSCASASGCPSGDDPAHTCPAHYSAPSSISCHQRRIVHACVYT